MLHLSLVEAAYDSQKQPSTLGRATATQNSAQSELPQSVESTANTDDAPQPWIESPSVLVENPSRTDSQTALDRIWPPHMPSGSQPSVSTAPSTATHAQGTPHQANGATLRGDNAAELKSSKRAREEQESWNRHEAAPDTSAASGTAPTPAAEERAGKAARTTNSQTSVGNGAHESLPANSASTAILTTRGTSVVPLLGNVYKGRSGISSNRGIKSNPEVMGDPNAPTAACMMS